MVLLACGRGPGTGQGNSQAPRPLPRTKRSGEAGSSRSLSTKVLIALKLLDGKGRGELKNFPLVVALVERTEAVSSSTRGALAGLQITVPRPAQHGSLQGYKNGFWGRLPTLWATLPQDLVQQGSRSDWSKIAGRAAKFLVTGIFSPPKRKKPVKDSSSLDHRSAPFVPSSNLVWPKAPAQYLIKQVTDALGICKTIVVAA